MVSCKQLSTCSVYRSKMTLESKPSTLCFLQKNFLFLLKRRLFSETWIIIHEVLVWRQNFVWYCYERKFFVWISPRVLLNDRFLTLLKFWYYREAQLGILQGRAVFGTLINLSSKIYERKTSQGKNVEVVS